jgi:hypothetical protein
MYRLALRAASLTGREANAPEIQAHLSRLLPGANLSTSMDLHRGGSTDDELSQMRNVKSSEGLLWVCEH